MRTRIATFLKGGVVFCLALSSVVLCSLIVTHKVVSALTYSQEIGVSFTFDSTLQLALSSDEISIPNLAPDMSADSNVITINILTNNLAGYTLNATVGNSTTYNTRDLVHNDSNQAANFSSVDYAATPTITALTNLEPSTWAYSYSADNGVAWVNYNGLPLWSDSSNIANLKDSNGPVASNAGDNVQFKIAARADTAQAAGEYNNVINFTLVAKPTPITLAMAYDNAGKTQQNGFYKLQDMTTSICSAVEAIDEPLQVIDARDNKVYWIAKLRDGKCWMTQNLDLDLGVNTLTHGGTTLYHDDTDLGWGTDTTTTSWTPNNATIQLDTNGQTFTSIGNNTINNTLPSSLNVGDWYYAGYNGTTSLASTEVNYLTSTRRVTEGNTTTVYDDTAYTNAYFRNTPFTGPNTSNNNTHGHVGNYYSWSAAVASNDTSDYSNSYGPTSNGSTYSNVDYNPQNSICPAGWRLPTITNASPTFTNAGSRNEFARLANLYANYTGVSSISNPANLEAHPLYFVRGGHVSGNSLNTSGNNGFYWSSTVRNGSNAYNFAFSATNATPDNTLNRNLGLAIRCVAR